MQTVASSQAGPSEDSSGDPVGLAPTGASAPTRRFRHPVLAFLVRRLAAGVVTLIVASALIFFATNVLPGDVAEIVLGRDATPQRLTELRGELGADQPLIVQYGDWLAGAVRGDLGQSAVALANGAPEAPVWDTIKTPLRNSFVLAAIIAVLLIPLSLLAGTIAAVRAGKATDYTVSYVALIIGSLPEFVVGTFLIAIFFSWTDLLPPVALVPPGASPLDDPQTLVLPVATLLGVAVGFSARLVRAGVIEVLRQDYVAMARLSGIRERRVLWRYALRNAMAPSVQTFARTIQYLFGGIIIVESLFSYPGLGQLLVQSVATRDFTLVQGITLILAAGYIVVNILADLIVIFLVPKLRTALR